MRRSVIPLVVATALVVAQGAIVVTTGSASLASSPAAPTPRGEVGEGGGGVTPDEAPAVSVSDPALDGSAGIALISSIEAVRTLASAASADEGPNEQVKPGLPWSYPVRWGTPITGEFGAPGPEWPGGHAGIDFNGDTGDPILAATDGRVTYAEFNYGGYGNLIMILRNDGTETRYAHLSKILVKDGERVKAGELIGRMGSTGDSSGSHLHFEVRVGPVPTPVDPASLWTGSRLGVPGKPPKWSCQKYGC